MLFSSALAQSAIQEGEPARELLLVDPVEGSDLLFELLSTVAADPREGTGVVSILRNVTDLRRATEEIEENYRKLRVAEAEVRAERDRLDLIIDSVADPIVVTDPAGGIVLMNAPAERLFTVAAARAAEEHAGASGPTTPTSPSFVSNLFFGGGGSRLARRDRPRRPRDGRAAARGGGLGQDPLRARRGDGDRHHPPRPHRGRSRRRSSTSS